MVEGTNPFFMPRGNEERDDVQNWDAYGLICDPINDKLDGLYADFRNILTGIRSTQRVPRDNVQFSIYECTTLNRAIEQATGLREIDVKEMTSRHAHLRRSLSYLNSIESSFRTPTARETNRIIQGYQRESDVDTRISCYELEVWLLMLAKPEGKEYWGLMRSIWQRIQSEKDLEDIGARRKLGDLGRMLHWLAPSKFFKDKSKYYPSNRYGHRTKNVEWIVPAGAPGLGRRA